MSAPRDYPIGYSEEEARRLENQAALFEELTQDVLRRAGLREGMQVLDLGCGVGDVSLLAARMVGASGAVLGVDRGASSVERARRRVATLGAGNIRFEEADLTTFDTAQTFDALIGRLVLLYLRDPAVVLRRLRNRVRPGGIVAFQELEIPTFSHSPPSELFDQMKRWILWALQTGGAELSMGGKLLGTFLKAGLPRPAMIASGRVESGPLSPAYDYFTQLVRSLMPLVTSGNITTEAEIDIETLSDRLRKEAVAKEITIFFPLMIGAWSQLPDGLT